MATRTLAVLVEVQVSVDDAQELASVKESLERRAREAVDMEPAVRTTWFSSVITRRPSPGDGVL